MAFEPSVVVFDACILYPFHLRNIVVQASVDRLVEARWTDEIHGNMMPITEQDMGDRPKRDQLVPVMR
jgi:hypothetical protein